jgi:hypothetical protein
VYVDIATARHNLARAGILAQAVLTDPGEADPSTVRLAEAVAALCQSIDPMLRAQPDRLRRRGRD